MATSFLLLLAAALVIWRGPAWRPRPLPGALRPRPWALGHRGARGPARENTLPALELALRRADGLETDVQRTRDGVLVLWHDFDVHGREIAASDLAELRAAAPEMPALHDLLALARRHPGTILNLEVKSLPRPLRPWALERDLVAAVRASGLADRVLVSSFDPFALLRVRLLAPELRTALLVASGAPRAWREGQAAGWLHVDALHPEHDLVDAAMLSRAAERGLPVHPWTVNEPERMRELVAAGVGALIGDDPEELTRTVRDAAAAPRQGRTTS